MDVMKYEINSSGSSVVAIVEIVSSSNTDEKNNAREINRRIFKFHFSLRKK